MKHFKKGICMLMAVALMTPYVGCAADVDAASKPKLSTTTVKVKVKKTKKVTIKNIKKYKIASVKSSKKTIATVKKKGNSAFLVKGVKKGSTVVKCVLKKASSPKITLSCKVKVSKDVEETMVNPPAYVTVAPEVTQAPAVPTATPKATAKPTPTPKPTAKPTPEPPAPTPLICKIADGVSVDLAYDVPAAYRETAKDAAKENQGTIESIKYDTETYDKDNSVKMTKTANVYLPAGYDKSKKYNILYLMHGGGENENTWLVNNDYTGNKKMIDNLIANKVIEPLIIVTPTFYRAKGAPDHSDLPAQFQYELRKDLIPYVESHYSTYAEGNTADENLIKTRMHRAFAGLSMGSMTTYRSALYGNYDVFAWFGPFSGCQGPGGNQDAEVNKIITTIEGGIEKGMPLGFLYCGNGVKDIAHDEHLQIMNKVDEKSDKITSGENYAFIDLPVLSRSYNGRTGEHSMWSWHIHLYNCLRLFFSKQS